MSKDTKDTEGKDAKDAKSGKGGKRLSWSDKYSDEHIERTALGIVGALVRARRRPRRSLALSPHASGPDAGDRAGPRALRGMRPGTERGA
jgi:hypothetical protein